MDPVLAMPLLIIHNRLAETMAWWRALEPEVCFIQSFVIYTIICQLTLFRQQGPLAEIELTTNLGIFHSFKVVSCVLERKYNYIAHQNFQICSQEMKSRARKNENSFLLINVPMTDHNCQSSVLWRTMLFRAVTWELCKLMFTLIMCDLLHQERPCVLTSYKKMATRHR
jgi:hypothetical protein